MEATWLLGNEKPKCKKGVERRRRRAIVENYTEKVLIFSFSLPHMCTRNTYVLEMSSLSDNVAPAFRGYSILTQSFVLMLFRKQ